MDTDEDGKRTQRLAISAFIITISIILILFAIPSKTASYIRSEREEQKTNTEDVLYAISYCESRHRQFNEDGTVLRGKENPLDVGKYQINEYWWLEDAKQMGFDIYIEKGNEQMARYILLEAQGIEAWSASRKCLADNFGIII